MKKKEIIDSKFSGSFSFVNMLPHNGLFRFLFEKISLHSEEMIAGLFCGVMFMAILYKIASPLISRNQRKTKSRKGEKSEQGAEVENVTEVRVLDDSREPICIMNCTC